MSKPPILTGFTKLWIIMVYIGWIIVLLDVDGFVHKLKGLLSFNRRQHLLHHEHSNDISSDRSDELHFYCPSWPPNTISLITFICNQRKVPNLFVKNANSISIKIINMSVTKLSSYT